MIKGWLISKIEDFDTHKPYSDRYSSKADNWATCDLLTFNIKDNAEKYYNLALTYRQSELPFRRRIGMYMLLRCIADGANIDEIFDLLDDFENEGHYDVNILNSWLLCECFIKQREKTLRYLEKTHSINSRSIKGFKNAGKVEG